jgi:membrane protein YdbS with pleckstrin-like domain
MKIEMSKTREQFPLSTKKIIKKTITGVILWLILLLMIVGFSSPIATMVTNGKIHLPVFIVLGCFILFILIIIVTYLYQRWYFAVYFYDLHPDYIQIRKGPITPKEITVPYERFQDVYVDQDIFDRIFGLYDVHISSATVSSGTEAHIDGLEKQAAEGLRNVILQTIQQRISRNKEQNNQTNNPIQSNQPL